MNHERSNEKILASMHVCITLKLHLEYGFIHEFPTHFQRCFFLFTVACGGGSRNSGEVIESSSEEQPSSLSTHEDSTQLIDTGGSVQSYPIAEDCSPTISPSVVSSGNKVATLIAENLDVYANCTSVRVGQNITFHLSDHAGSFDQDREATVAIARVGVTDEPVWQGLATMRKHQLPLDAWINCCNWPVGLALKIPENWKPGFYRATFRSPEGRAGVDFVVRLREPGTYSKLVLNVPFDTVQAYNNWGGKSVYRHSSSDGLAATRVSLLRPNRKANQDNVVIGIIPFIRWAESRGYALELITSEDLHRDPNVLSAYKVVLLVGHDEYWSQTMRDQLDTHLDTGKHVAIFSGNTMWWRTVREADVYGRSSAVMVAEKAAGTETDYWYRYDPESRTILSSYYKGGYIGDSSLNTIPYTVEQPEHWIFAGTGFVKGTQFGAAEQIHSYESDGVDYVRDSNGKAIPTGSDGTPTGTEILALAPLDGWSTYADSNSRSMTGVPGPWAAMSIYTRPSGGIIFNAATTHYYKALEPCTGSTAEQSTACRIATNVIDYLSR